MDRVVSRFHTDVVQRWTRHRAEVFFQAFCQEVSVGLLSHNKENVDVLLDMILESDARSEVMFDSYRRVCLSRSKDLGPRIIGLLTAKLVVAERQASHVEEMIFMAAEQLNDEELLRFASFYEGKKTLAESNEKNGNASFDERGNLDIKWRVEQIKSNLNRGGNISLAPLNLANSLGSWASKLKPLGFVADDVKERQWQYGGQVDEAVSVREVSWWVSMPSMSAELVDFIRRCSPEKIG